jgi:hypothetical protein
LSKLPVAFGVITVAAGDSYVLIGRSKGGFEKLQPLTRQEITMQYLKLLYFTICFVICLSERVLAQGAEVEITFPVDESTEVIIQPTIIIKTKFPIDSSSVTWVYARSDSGAPITHWPTLRLLPKVFADSLADSVQKKAAIPGEYELIDDTTLHFTPISPLSYGVEYKATVKNLAVVVDTAIGPGSPDTVSVADTSITFTTVLPTHAVLGSNIGPESTLRCGDTIFLVFNRPLTSDTSATGPFVTLERLDSVQYVSDTNYTTFKDTVAVSTWLMAPDSNVMCIKSTGVLDPGAQYFLHVETSKLTGDTLDDVTYTMYVRDRFALNVTTADEDTTQSAPPSSLTSHANISYHQAGTTVRLDAIDQNSSYAFVRWECQGFPAIHNNTNSTITFSQSCGALTDLNVTAVFRQRDTIRVQVRDTLHTWVRVYHYSTSTETYTYAGDTGTYTLLPDERLQVYAGSDTSALVFDQWFSNTSEFHGETTPVLRISNNGKIRPGIDDVITIGPNYPVAPVFSKCGLCTYVSWQDIILSNIDPATALAVTPPPYPAPCDENDPNIPGNPACPVPTAVTAAVTSSCYKITDILVIQNGVEIYHYSVAPGSGLLPLLTWSSAAAPLDALLRGNNLNLQKLAPYTEVYFGIRSQTYDLEVVTKLLQARKFLDEGQVGADRDVRIRVWRVNGSNKWLAYQTPNQALPANNRTTVTATNTLTFLCGEIIEVRAEADIREEGFEFNGWVTGTGYTYPTPNTLEAFQFVMDQNRKVEGEFEEFFRLRKVGVYRLDATSAPTWYNVPSISAGSTMTSDLNVWLSTVSNIHYGSKLHFKFNDVVQTTTLDPNLAVTEISERLDWPERGDVDPDTRLTWLGTSSRISTASSGREIIMELASHPSGPPGITRGVQFHTFVRAGVENTNSERLDNPADFHMETEMPGLDIRVISAMPLALSGDWDLEVDLYTRYEGAITSPSGAVVSSSRGNYPASGDPPGVAPETAQTWTTSTGGQFIVASADKVDRSGAVGLSLQSWDDDGYDGMDKLWDYEYGGDEPSSLQIALAFILAAGALIGTGPALGLLGITGGIATILTLITMCVVFLGVGYYGDEIWDAIKNALAGGDDDWMGDHMWTYKWGPHVWFGGHPDADREQSRPDTDLFRIGYNVDFRLKK